MELIMKNYDAADLFLKNMPSGFMMVRVEQFKEKITSLKSNALSLLDLRGETAFTANGVPGSINCLLTDLPERYTMLLPDKNKEVIIYCNGGIQSIYAVMYLTMKGYTDVKSLAGGFSMYLE